MLERTQQRSLTERRPLPPAAFGILGLLVVSALAVSIAPAFMPDSYSVIEHAVSASAAQGVDNAWIARSGFLFLVLAALWLVEVRADAWGPPGRFMFRVYAAALVAATVFGQRPWFDGPFDLVEDVLHQIAATVVAVAFTAGVLVVMVRRNAQHRRPSFFDLVAVAAAVFLPVIMFNVTPVHGLAQRALFVVGYAWFGAEAIRAMGSRESAAAIDSRQQTTGAEGH